jgi:mono/diheme cytochrome c family protein
MNAYQSHSPPRQGLGDLTMIPAWASGTARVHTVNPVRVLSRWIRPRMWLGPWLLIVSILGYPWLHNLVLGVEITPAERGYRVAVRAGCFNCHGPNGTGGVKNPGSEDGEVPGFAGGTPMMWVNGESELREYILDGAPARKRADPRHWHKVGEQLLAMPAYRGYIGDREVDDLVAYLRVVSGLIAPADELAAQGQDLAYRFGCFNCHGPMGYGSSRNLGSLKGYIPGWWGNDFRELVHNDAELREWIVDGEPARLRNHPLAKFFIRSQRVSMPAYRAFLTDTQLSALMSYVRWVNGGAWQQKPLELAR